MAKKKTKVKYHPRPPQPLTKFQKGLIALGISLIPMTIFVFVPLYCRNYFIKELKLPEEIFLSAPEHVDLVNTADVGPCYRVKINGYSFAIPLKFTPSKVDYDGAEFRVKSRSEGRYIAIRAERRTRTINFKAQGITHWFLPKETRKFMPIILNATWHPIRLMFKAQFYAFEGITSKIFTSNWDTHHRGYIFPTTRNEGYLGRVYRTNADGTFEFLMSDSVFPVTLRDWVNMAMKVQTPTPNEIELQDEEIHDESVSSFEDLMEMANGPEMEPTVIGYGLNEFYRTKNSEWLIPVGKVMQERGFFPDVLDLIHTYRADISANSQYNKWDDLLQKCVSESIAMEIDPQLTGLRELNVYCRNLTDLDLTQVTIEVEVTSNIGLKQSFSADILDNQFIRSKEEKTLQVKVPSDISLANSAGITYKVTNLLFDK